MIHHRLSVPMIRVEDISQRLGIDKPVAPFIQLIATSRPNTVFETDW